MDKISSNTRKERGIGILAKINDIEKVSKNHYRVRSQTVLDRKYDVMVTLGNVWTCTCPDFHYRLRRCDDKHCKHIVSCLELRDAIDEKLGVKKDDSPFICGKCDSTKIVKNGHHDLKTGKRQRYKCNQCGYRFVLTELGFEKTSKEPYVIEDSIDMFFKGMSSRKIAQHFARKNISMSHVAVLIWVKKYMRIVRDYTDTIVPNLGDVLSTDEMVLNVRKVAKRKKGFYRWLWGTMDPKTRMILATAISSGRSIEEAKNIFRASKGRTASALSYAITDRLKSYNAAIRAELGESVAHVKTRAIEIEFSNRPIERFWNEVREIIKTRRGFDNEETAEEFMEFYRVYHNYMRSHMGLGGLTPAEAADTYLELGPNKLGDLIKLACEHKRSCIHQLGAKMLAKVDVSNDGKSVTVRPKVWLGKDVWIEITSILKTGGFSWISNGKDSCWLKVSASAAQA